jgi:cyclophilin family peptidyl-prolyl cis-trans isomerase
MRIAAVIATLVAVLGACSGPSAVPPDPDAMPFTGDKPEVVMSTTLGDLVVRLEPGEMPNTTANFLEYVDSGWYDGTLIHRVEAEWVIQGGGYTTGLEAKTPNPPIDLETSDQVLHVHGAISMARTSDPNSATSQWFIVDWPNGGTPPQAQLDGDYAAFGILIEGFDVLADITAVSVGTVGQLENTPVTEIVVTSAHRR